MTSFALAAWLFASGASAQDDEEVPLAIPASPPERVTIQAPSPPVLEPPSQTRALRAYRDRYLAVRNYSEIVTGTTTHTRWRYGPYRRRGRVVAWSTPWAYRVDAVGVFRGEERLDVPATLGALGDIAGKNRLQRQIRSQQNASTALQAIGVAGIGTVVVGLIGRDQANTFGEFRSWEQVTLAGVGMSVGGFVFSAFPSARARRLQFSLEETFDVEVLRHQVADHNEVLAEELGLDPREALQLER